MQLYALDPDEPLGPALAAALEEPLAAFEERCFEDGERKLRPLHDPHGHEAVIVAALHGVGASGPTMSAPTSPHDRLWRLMLLAATLRDHGAARVTAVLPYLAYARKDRRTQPWDPLSLRVLAQALESAGVAQVVAFEAHDTAAFENAFRVPVVNVPAWPVFEALAWSQLEAGPVTVAAPDPGGVRRALALHTHLAARATHPTHPTHPTHSIGFAMVDKRRSGGVLTGGHLVAGEVEGRTVLLVDDLVATGHTLAQAAAALKRAGARGVVALAAHGLFTSGAAQALAEPALDTLVVTDSVPGGRLPLGSTAAAKLQVLSAAPLLAHTVAQLASRR
jgi:ribose-phosphate pyrophosphokinase